MDASITEHEEGVVWVSLYPSHYVVLVPALSWPTNARGQRRRYRDGLIYPIANALTEIMSCFSRALVLGHLHDRTAADPMLCQSRSPAVSQRL